MESSAAPGHQGVVPASHGFSRPETAGKWEDGSSSDPEPDYTREPGHLALARIVLARERPGRRSPCSAALSRASERTSRGHCPRIDGHPGHRQSMRATSWARSARLTAPRPWPGRVTVSPRRPGTNAGPGYTLVPSAARKIPPGMSPLGRGLSRQIFLACRGRNAHRKGSAMATVTPDLPTAAPRSPLSPGAPASHWPGTCGRGPCPGGTSTACSRRHG